MDLNLDGKRALVCGSTQGMGLAIGIELAKQGASVTLFARDEEKLKKVVEELPGDDHDYLVADFDQLDQVKSAAEIALHKGNYQILINNTGGPAPGKIYEASINDFETAIKRHLFVSQTLSQLVIPGMQSDGYGRIVNIISTSVKIPITGLGVSNTVRGAMASWAKTMANELGQFGITVNNILPGFINTGRITSLIANRSKAQERTQEEIKNEMVSSIPAGRFGEPEEIADYAAFLCSPSGAYINGTSLQVDGGRTGSI
ncbi:MAG: SDR family oxidoreductase [Cyclobacteriaceae bacterium]